MNSTMNGPHDRPALHGVVSDGWTPGEFLFAAAVGLAGGCAGIVWGGAILAARLTGHHLDASLGVALQVAVHLPGHLSDPAAAWPGPLRAALPGPSLYWLCQFVVVAAAIAVGVGAWRLFRPVRARDGLGVERSARFATRRDLRRLAVTGPTPARIILGRVGGRLVAAEERTGVCIVGPSQSGKTSGLCVPALLELEKGSGAVIAASVKGDLHAVTHQRRGAVGEVKVFDPTCVVTDRSATWSPLRAAATVTGAQAAARGLVEVAGSGRLEDADFWMSAAKELLWPLLFVAGRTNGTMADVVRWVTTQDRPTFKQDGLIAREGEVAARIRQIEAADNGHPDQPVVQGRPVRPGGDPPTGPPDERSLATAALAGIWACDERTRSAIYTTARTVIEAWSDPVVARAAQGCDITPDWLLNGDNTLYIVAPARDQARFRPVFASLVADLVNGAFDAAARRPDGTLEHQLLVLLDEAANICPVKELPTWCSTCPSHGITLVTVWQDRSQQHRRYGREGAETIWNNSGAKVILSGLADHATAELTGLLGDEEHQRMGRSFEISRGRRTLSSQTATRRLVTEDSLRRQQPGQALLVYKDLPPARLALRPWHKDRTLRALKGGTR
jgi:type IV secretion system protein VirD4